MSFYRMINLSIPSFCSTSSLLAFDKNNRFPLAFLISFYFNFKYKISFLFQLFLEWQISTFLAFILPQFLIKRIGSFCLLLYYPQFLIWDKLSVLTFCKIRGHFIAINKYFSLAFDIKHLFYLSFWIQNNRFFRL